MVNTRQYTANNNIKLYEGLPLKKKNNYKNDDTHYVFRFLMLIWFFSIIFTTSTIVYHYLFRDNNSLYNFVIIDLPEKTYLKLYNNIPARPYNYIMDKFNEILQDYNINYF